MRQAPASQASYDQTPSADADPREIEAWALLKSARQLDDASRAPENPDELRNCLRQNQLLWTIFQSAVAGDDSPLPLKVRETVLNLSLIVDKHTFSCLADLDPEKVPALVEINRNVALGLMGQPGEGFEQPATAHNRQSNENEIPTTPVSLDVDC